MHTVEVDTDAARKFIADVGTRAKLAEMKAETASEQLSEQIENAGSDPQSWMQGARLALTIVDAKVCPNWKLQDEEKTALAESLAETMDHYFPGGPNGMDNWHPLVKLVGVCALISLPRCVSVWPVKFEPFHNRQENAQSETADAAARRDPNPDNGGESNGENVVGFKTDGQ